MKRLITTRTMVDKKAIIETILALGIGFWILSAGIPVIGAVSLAIGGFIGLYQLFGMTGLREVFQKPNKLIRNFLVAYLSAILLGLVMSLIVREILHAPTVANEVTKNLSTLFLIQTLPMLLGEELLTMIILLLIANLLGGSKKGVAIGILVSTLVFALLHLPTYHWNLLQCLLIIGIARLPFTWASLSSDSLWTGYAVHVAYDWTAFILVMFLANGG